MTPDIHAAVAAANQKFMEAFARQDAAGVASLYTGDAQLLPVNSDFVTGISAEAHGDTVVEIGKYALGGESGRPR